MLSFKATLENLTSLGTVSINVTRISIFMSSNFYIPKMSSFILGLTHAELTSCLGIK